MKRTRTVARILVHYTPAGDSADLKGRTLPVLHKDRRMVEVAHGEARIVFTRKEVAMHIEK